MKITKKVLMKALELIDKKMSCNACPIPKPCRYERMGCSSNWINEVLEYADKQKDVVDNSLELLDAYILGDKKK